MVKIFSVITFEGKKEWKGGVIVEEYMQLIAVHHFRKSASMKKPGLNLEPDMSNTRPGGQIRPIG